MVFCPEALVLAAADALRRHAELLDEEQAAHGLDSLAELDLHPLVRQGFASAGLGVLAEWPYPSHLPARGGAGRGMGAKAAAGPAERDLPRHPRDRQRCDIVLLEESGARLLDPIAARIAAREAAKTAPLFAELAPPPNPTAAVRFSSGEEGERFSSGGSRVVEPEEAFWVEVKAIGQFSYSAGIPVPNRTYTSELLATAAADLPKLAADPRIRHWGLLVVLFAVDRQTAEHDLGTFMRRCQERGLIMGATAIEGFALLDRIGNGWCAAALACGG